MVEYYTLPKTEDPWQQFRPTRKQFQIRGPPPLGPSRASSFSVDFALILWRTWSTKRSFMLS